MERVAVSFCGLWSLKPLDVSNDPASRGLQPTTSLSLPVLPLENPQARPACLFKKTALSVSFVACRSPGGYPMHRDSFCVTKSRRFYRTKPVLLLISTTANVALGLKTNNNRRVTSRPPWTWERSACIAGLQICAPSLSLSVSPYHHRPVITNDAAPRHAQAQDYRSAGTTNLKRSRPGLFSDGVLLRRPTLTAL